MISHLPRLTSTEIVSALRARAGFADNLLILKECPLVPDGTSSAIIDWHLLPHGDARHRAE